MPRANPGWRKTLAAAAALLISALALLTPALLNGFPFPNSDTISYFRVGEAAAVSALRALAPSEAQSATDDSDGLARSLDGAPPSEKELKLGGTYLGARSIVYGLSAFLLSMVGGLWAIAAAQALALALGVRLLASVLWPMNPDLGGPLLSLLLVASTPLGFLASNIMPDVLLTLGALGLAVLLASERLGRANTIAAMLGVGLAVCVHSTHSVILLAAFAVGAAVRRLLSPSWSLHPVAAAGAAICVAILMGLGLKITASAVAGEPLRNPPFLMARVVADGPGLTYLRNTCPVRHLAMCRFLDRPLNDSQVILWDANPATGVFWPADVETRIQLIEEQNTIVFGALQTDPLGVAGSVARNLATLAMGGRLAAELDWNMPPELYRPLELWHSGAAQQYARSAAVQDRMPFDLIDGWFRLAALGFLAFGLFTAGRRFLPSSSPGRTLAGQGGAWMAAAVFATVFIANWAVCGALSGPFDRYQARGMPLLGLVAVALWATQAARLPFRRITLGAAR